MAKRSVRRRRRLEQLNRDRPYVPPERATKCAADDCPEDATKIVEIDGVPYDVCDIHGELVMIQTQRRTEARRRSGDVEQVERRLATERALGVRR